MTEEQRIPTPAPADLPSFKIKINGSEISAEYQVQGVVVMRAFNKIASAELILFDGDPSTEEFKLSSSEDFIPGNEVEVLAGYHSNDEVIFKGLVVRHGLKVHKERPAVLRIECRDAAVKLTVGRKNAYFYDSSDSEIIEELASSAGLQPDVEATAVTHVEMVQLDATDWDFIVTRAEANGKLVATQDGTLVAKAPDSSTEPVLSLAYGSSLLEFEAMLDARSQYKSIQSSAWDAANQEMLEAEAEDPSALTPGNLTAGDLAAVIDLEQLRLKHAGQVSDQELQVWADGYRMRTEFSKVRGRARVQGFAGIHPGDMVELGGVGDRFSGSALVSGVRHEINAKNWETDIAFGLAPETFAAEHPDLPEARADGLLPAISGLHIGLVTALEGDPNGEDRVQVRIPMIDPGEQGVWARVVTLDAGQERGSFFRPEIGDEVILGFLNDDPRNPVILGMMNSSAKPAPLAASDDNPEKGFVTRSGIKLLFNDELVSLTVETPNGNKIVLSDESGSALIEDENGNKALLDSSGISLESASDLILKASGDINLEGVNITASASAQLKAEGSAAAEVSSGGTTTVKGSVVMIN